MLNGNITMLRILASCWNRERLDVFEAKIKESEKAGSRRESNPGHLSGFNMRQEF